MLQIQWSGPVITGTGAVITGTCAVITGTWPCYYRYVALLLQVRGAVITGTWCCYYRYVVQRWGANEVE